MKNKKILGFITIIIVLIGFVYYLNFRTQKVVYVCDFTDRFDEFQEATIEVELEYQKDNLIAENSVQKYWFHEFTSSYSKEYYSRRFSEYHADGYDIDVNVDDDLIEITTNIKYNELNTSDLKIFENDAGKILLSDSIDQLEANNCIKK